MKGKTTTKGREKVMELSNKSDIAVSVVAGVVLYIAIKQSYKLSRKAYRRLRPAK